MNRVLLDQILELPLAQRVELAQQIWESVHEYPEALHLTQTQIVELERRWRAFEQHHDE